MFIMEATEVYEKALKEGQREYRECILKRIDPNPLVLDDILDPAVSENAVDVGQVNVPLQRIVGTKTAGRVTAFTPSFRPLMDPESEFGRKWISLCADH